MKIAMKQQNNVKPEGDRRMQRFLRNSASALVSADHCNMPLAARNSIFATTQWSIVVAAGEMGAHEARLALAQLCETYWYPLYAYVRRRVGNVHEAQDLTQAFFCHLLEKQTIARADRSRGRFRTFLVTALKNFLNNDAAVPGLNRNQAYSLKIITPPVEILTLFCKFVDDFERQAAVLRIQNTTLRHTRDLLLPRLISGEVDVSELDIATTEEI